MSFPATCTLTGSFYDTSGNPATGEITFTPSAELTDTAGNIILPQIPITVQVTGGTFTVHLLPTDTAGISQTGWSYQVNEQILLYQSRPFTTNVTYYVQPTGTGTIQLSSLAQYTTPPSVITYGVLSGNNTWTGTNAFTAETTVPTPTNSADAATKSYVDSHTFTGAQLKSGWFYPTDGGNPNHSMLFNTLWVSPFDLQMASATVNLLACNVVTGGTAGSTIRLGIYGNDGRGGIGSLIVDAGTVAGDATGVMTKAVSAPISQGRIWLGAVWQGTDGSAPVLQGNQRIVQYVGFSSFVNSFASPYGYSFGSISGALPLTLPTPTSFENGHVPTVQFTIA